VRCEFTAGATPFYASYDIYQGYAVFHRSDLCSADVVVGVDVWIKWDLMDRWRNTDRP